MNGTADYVNNGASDQYMKGLDPIMPEQESLRYKIMVATGGQYTEEQEDAMMHLIEQDRERAVREARIDENEYWRHVYATAIEVMPDDRKQFMGGQISAYRDSIADHTDRIAELNEERSEQL